MWKTRDGKTRGHRGPTKDGKGNRPWVLRGHPHNQNLRLRPVDKPAVGYVEDESSVLALSFDYGEEDLEDHMRRTRELLLAGVLPEHASIFADDIVLSAPTPATVHVQIATGQIPLICPELLASGQYLLAGEDQERGLYVLEPLWAMVAPGSIKEQNWDVKFTGLVDQQKQTADLPAVYAAYGAAVDAGMADSPILVSPSTMKRVTGVAQVRCQQRPTGSYTPDM